MAIKYKLKVHPKVVTEDLPLIKELYQEDFNETLDSIEKVINNEILLHPDTVGAECRFELNGFKRHKFFTELKAHPRTKPAGRIKFKVDHKNKNVYVLAIGIRGDEERLKSKNYNIGKIDSPYFVAKNRLPEDH